ncbi:MAG: LOG family protein [Deltaproteobacteria bacterium]|nr:LOG family protein [Deltaproteobacteria bacterium]
MGQLNNDAAALSVQRKPFIVGVMGSHKEEPSVMEDARRLGEAIARRGHVLLTGGGPGLMRAASEGAYRAGGLVIGILPNDRRRILNGYPNEFVHIPIYTGMSDARNVINAKTPHMLVALNGSVGTLSEIALALRVGTPVIGLHCPKFSLPEDQDFTPVASIEEAIREMDRILERCNDHAAGCAKNIPLL